MATEGSDGGHEGGCGCVPCILARQEERLGPPKTDLTIVVPERTSVKDLREQNASLLRLLGKARSALEKETVARKQAESVLEPLLDLCVELDRDALIYFGDDDETPEATKKCYDSFRALHAFLADAFEGLGVAP